MALFLFVLFFNFEVPLPTLRAIIIANETIDCCQMKKIAFFLLLLPLSAFLLAQSASKPTVFELFQTEDYLSITLESDYQNLIKNKNRDDYQPAVITYTDEDGKPVRWELEIKPRGKMRRRICSMPPLKLKFPKSEIKAKGLAKFKTLEMVDICNPTPAYQQYVLREYVAYKLYNMLTNQSFRVQLVKVDFINTGGKKEPMDGFCILIENNEEMAKRLGGKIIEPVSINRKVPNSSEKELFSMFQYMIGNTDWWYATAHNMDIFCKLDSIMPIPIPYDFDYSGFVNTTYSVPNDKIPVKYVTDRFYIGPCMPSETTKKTIQLFLDKKADMLKYCNDFPYFTKYTRKSTIKYLKSFFATIEKESGIKNSIYKTCNFYE